VKSLAHKLLALAFGLSAAPALAQVTSFPPPPPPTMVGPYLGATLGYARAKKGCLGVLSGGGRTCDDNDMSWGGFAGYRLLRYLAAELAYKDLGRITASAPGASTEHIHAVVMDAAVLGIVPLDEHLSAHLRIGAYRATLDTSVRGVEDHTNGNLTYGAGLQWDLIGNLSLRFDWQRYKKVGGDGTPYGLNFYDVMSVGALWRFH
jgi:opacity protein-like surface antigen